MTEEPLDVINENAIESIPTPTPAPDPNPSQDGQMPNAVWKQKWNFKLLYGMGLPLNQTTTPTHFQLDWSRPLGRQTELGLYVHQSSANYHDLVLFPSTGYEEDRDYRLRSIGTGISFSYRTEHPLTLIANLGFSRTTSELRSVTTTAPMPPTLTLGEVDAEAWGFAYRIGVSYEKIWRSLALGTQLSYGSTSSIAEAEIKDIALGLFIKFYQFDENFLANP